VKYVGIGKVASKEERRGERARRNLIPKHVDLTVRCLFSLEIAMKRQIEM
jgi:hypothetical protein